MATSGTSFARAIDGIPVVPNTAARDARFKNPEVDQRVENRETGYVERWDGAQWVPDIATSASAPVFNVRAFGAKGNGVADDAAAFQAAVTAAAAAGGIVFVPAPASYYAIGATVLCPSGTTILGVGRASLIKRKAGSLSAGVPGNLFKNTNYSNTASTDRNIGLSGLRLSMNSEGGNVRPSSSRDYATLHFGGVTGLWLSDLWLEESLHFTINVSYCDDAHLRNIDIRAQYASTPAGNVDGVHFGNCRNFSLVNARIDSGDDMVGVTTDLGGRTSYNGVIRNVRGSSKEANGVIVNTEGTGGFDLTNIAINGVRFRSAAAGPVGVAVRFKGDCTSFPSTYNVVCGRSIVSDVVGESCGNAMELAYAQGVTASNILADTTWGHGVQLNPAKDCTLTNISTRNAGNVSDNYNGVHIAASDRIRYTGGTHVNARFWGVQINQGTDIAVDQVSCFGCGRQTAAGSRGGFRVNAATRASLGAACTARDDGNNYTAYGLALEGACVDVKVYGAPANYSGITAAINHTAGGAELAFGARSVVSKTAAYTATTSDDVILCDASGGAFTVMLPSAGFTNKQLTIKKTDASANAVTVDGNGAQTIDGALTQALASQNAAITIRANGTGWSIIGKVA